MRKSEGWVRSRKDHQYAPTGSEEITPIDEIPPQFRRIATLPGGNKQIVDSRLCYNWEPGDEGGRMVECSSVASHASQEHFAEKEGKKGCALMLPIAMISLVKMLLDHPELWNS
ncbi:MAG: hypothetical protein XD95_0230 [Microgenomates bacterium 39_7]|nr:MAG: hypothetical protein XD95_0230 [Microgenomates bacterium 39_7]